VFLKTLTDGGRSSFTVARAEIGTRCNGQTGRRVRHRLIRFLMRDVHHHVEEKNHSVRIQFRAIVNHSTVQDAMAIDTGRRSLSSSEVIVLVDKPEHDLLDACTPDLRFVSVVLFRPRCLLFA
jgi:hypothetical protein